MGTKGHAGFGVVRIQKMKLDSEKQREYLLLLIGRVPFQTNVAELLRGVDPELLALIEAIRQAEV